MMETYFYYVFLFHATTMFIGIYVIAQFFKTKT